VNFCAMPGEDGICMEKECKEKAIHNIDPSGLYLRGFCNDHVSCIVDIAQNHMYKGLMMRSALTTISGDKTVDAPLEADKALDKIDKWDDHFKEEAARDVVGRISHLEASYHSIRMEIRDTLKVRGHWVPKDLKSCNLITAVGRALEDKVKP